MTEVIYSDTVKQDGSANVCLCSDQSSWQHLGGEHAIVHEADLGC
jgi:hypothetical protein